MSIYILFAVIILLMILVVIWRWYNYRRRRAIAQQKLERHTNSQTQVANNASNLEQNPLNRLNQDVFQRLYTKLMLAGFVPVTSVDTLVGSEQRRQKQMVISVIDAFAKEPKACWEILEAVLPKNTLSSKKLRHEFEEFIQVEG